MRCISLWQPWASLCCITHPDDPFRSVKGFETRSWATLYRGGLLIHAAKRFQRGERQFCHTDPLRSILASIYPCPECLPVGAVIGQVTLVGCYPTESVRDSLDDFASSMGDYADGRYAWELTWPVLFPEPIPYRGQQGFFDVPSSMLPPPTND